MTERHLISFCHTMIFKTHHSSSINSVPFRIHITSLSPQKDKMSKFHFMGNSLHLHFPNSLGDSPALSLDYHFGNSLSSSVYLIPVGHLLHARSWSGRLGENGELDVTVLTLPEWTTQLWQCSRGSQSFHAGLVWPPRQHEAGLKANPDSVIKTDSQEDATSRQTWVPWTEEWRE